MEPINETELHAYADGALPDARRVEVDAWLASHPEDMQKVRDWMIFNRAMHASFDDVLNEPVPIHLIRSAKNRPNRLFYRAAAILAFAATGLVGYWAGQHSTDGQLSTVALAHDAAIAHVVFSSEVRHPVEVQDDGSGHLVAWLSKRLGAPLQAPDFQTLGYKLMGGRLLSNESGPVAQFMYENAQNQRVTLYVRRDARNNRETAFRHATEDGVRVFYWIDRDFGYALSGQIDEPDIRQLAELAYRQMNTR